MEYSLLDITIFINLYCKNNIAQRYTNTHSPTRVRVCSTRDTEFYLELELNI